jgi:diamine N-acetyltransferase
VISLRPVTREDIAEIESWPPYEGVFEQMDYAVRKGGWLDEYGSKPATWIYSAESDGRLVGFTLLSATSSSEAEFRIAVHPRLIGKGYGREMAFAIQEIGFTKLNLNRLYLIVRKSNYPAMKLYESIGFRLTGESTHDIQGKPVEFYDMDMTRESNSTSRGE